MKTEDFVRVCAAAIWDDVWVFGVSRMSGKIGLSIICCSSCLNLTESLLETICPNHVHTGWTCAADQDVLQ